MPILSVSALLVFVGFYLLYSASEKKIPSDKSAFMNRRLSHSAPIQPVAAGLLLGALTLLLLAEGIATGSFTYFILLMTLGSLIILLAPLRMLTVWPLITAFAGMLLTEIIFS